MSSTYKNAPIGCRIAALLLVFGVVTRSLDAQETLPEQPMHAFRSAGFEASLRSFPPQSFEQLPKELAKFQKTYVDGDHAALGDLCNDLFAVTRRNPPRADVPYFLCAIGEILSDDPVGGEDLLKQALESRAASSDILVLLGYLHLQRADFVPAQSLFQEASWFQRYHFISPGYAPYFLGTLLLQQGRLTDAATWLQRALNLQPDSSEVRIAMADLRLAEGNIPQALSVLREGVQKSPSDIHLRLMLVDKLLEARSGALDDATDREITALLGSAAPEDTAFSEQVPDYFALSAERALRRNELAEAADLLKQARKRFPQHAGLAKLQQDYEAQVRVQAARETLEPTIPPPLP